VCILFPIYIIDMERKVLQEFGRVFECGENWVVLFVGLVLLFDKDKQEGGRM